MAKSVPDELAEWYRNLSDSDKLAEWYKALREENCRKVKIFLNDDGKFLKEGWKAETKAMSQPDDQKAETEAMFQSNGSKAEIKALSQPDGWKARTAVHVAARRGDVKLMALLRNEYSGNLDEGNSSYSQFLQVVDGDYELNALAMAVVNGHQDIVDLLTKPILPVDSSDTTPSDSSDIRWRHGGGSSSAEVVKEGNDLAEVLKKIISEILQEDSSGPIRKMYADDCDFNFLDINVYFFHFTFSTWESSSEGFRDNLIRKVQDRIISEACAKQSQCKSLLKFLLCDLWDGQGRTPLHVAVDSSKVSEYISVINPMSVEGHLRAIDSKRAYADVIGPDLHALFLTNTDSTGRTPLYRAAAQDLHFSVRALLQDSRTDILGETKFTADQWGKAFDIDQLSWRNGFKSECVYVTEEKLQRKGFNNEGNSLGGPGPYIPPLTEISSTALHIAIIHKHKRIVKLLLKPPQLTSKEEEIRRSSIGTRCVNFTQRLWQRPTGDEQVVKQAQIYCRRRFPWPVAAALQGDGSGFPYKVQQQALPMQLAVLVGNIPILQELLEDKDSTLEEVERDEVSKSGIQSFLLAAAKGAPGTIKAFLDRMKGNFNPLIHDNFDNTALHHALKGKNVTFHPHMVDFVGCHHVYNWRWKNYDWVTNWLGDPEEKQPESEGRTKHPKDAVEKGKYGQRMGAINLLLDAGINIWEKNKQRRTATPDPEADDEFVKWWSEKVTEDTQHRHEQLSSAANAISVTAALVATASYVGPLTPPLGYSDELSVRVNISAVRVFVVCDSLSFYLALAAIMLSLLPSLPLKKESMFRSLVRTRMLVAISVSFLFPSIICVLLAFAAGYVAAIPDHGWAYHGISLAPMIAGGFLCFIVIGICLQRLRRVLGTLPSDFEKELHRFHSIWTFISCCGEKDGDKKE